MSPQLCQSDFDKWPGPEAYVKQKYWEQTTNNPMYLQSMKRNNMNCTVCTYQTKKDLVNQGIQAWLTHSPTAVKRKETTALPFRHPRDVFSSKSHVEQPHHLTHEIYVPLKLLGGWTNQPIWKNRRAVKMGIIIFPKWIFSGLKFQQICGKNHHPVKGSHPPLGGDPHPLWPPSSCGTPRPCRRRHPLESPVVVLIVGLIKGSQWVFMKPWS